MTTDVDFSTDCAVPKTTNVIALTKCKLSSSYPSTVPNNPNTPTLARHLPRHASGNLITAPGNRGNASPHNITKGCSTRLIKLLQQQQTNLAISALEQYYFNHDNDSPLRL